ncbi:MAG TPA: DUF2269 family protein [Jatrophihabitans sp.]|nr:DUF2269 family protein [Jatrophihabitans sp.]
MFRFLLALHILFAVFAIGPLVHAATTASRGVRRGDGAATAASARLLRVYSYASVLVVLVGFALMSTTSVFTGKKAAEFGDTYIWLSVLLYVVAIALIVAIVIPALDRATQIITEQGSVVTLTGRVAAAGGLVGLIFAGIVFLMVYRPGT